MPRPAPEPDSPPVLSVIIVSYNARATIGRCLAALEHQTVRDGYEVLVVDSSTDGTADLIAARFPHVRLVRCAERKYPGDARNIGIAHARGALIAFVDADCVADPRWIEEVLAAHRQDHPVIGGAVANGSVERSVGWAYYFTEFFHWMPGARQGLMEDIPTCTLSMKRTAFQAWGPFLEGTYCSDSVFNWNMARDGQQPLFVPAIQVAHLYEGTLWQFLTHEMQHGRFFAAVRVREQRIGLMGRLFNAACAPARPLVWSYRIARAVFARRRHQARFLRTAPLVFLGRTAWAYGELLGYLSPASVEAQ